MAHKTLVGVTVLALTLVCPLHAAISVQPYLQNPTQQSMDILWWTDTNEANSRVEYGTDFQSHVSVTPVYVPQVGRYLNQATIQNLLPGTTYPYRVISGDSVGAPYTLTTAPSADQAAAQGVHIGVLGDGRTDDETVRQRHRELAHLARSRGATLLFELGDMVYDGTQTHWDYLMQAVLTTSSAENAERPTASLVPYLMAVGNHEIYGGDGGYAKAGLTDTMPRYQAFVSHPDNGSADPRWKERYYSLRYGPVTFIVLDANNTSDDELDNHRDIPDGYSPDWEPGSEQYRWMIRQLEQAQSDSVFTIVMAHPASYSRGVHGTNDNPGTDYQTGYELRVLDSIFRQYGVDAVIQSHDHLVEHCVTGPQGWWNQPGAFHRDHPDHAAWSNDPKNLNYIVMGNSGEGSRDAHPHWTDWMDIQHDDPQAPPATYYSDYFYDWAGDDQKSSYLDVQLAKADQAWKATLKVVRRDNATGEVAEFDEFALTRAEPH